MEVWITCRARREIHRVAAMIAPDSSRNGVGDSIDPDNRSIMNVPGSAPPAPVNAR